MKILILVFIFLISVPALADLSGLYSGVGFMKDGDGWSSECPFAYLALRETQRRFSVREGYFNCDEKQSGWMGSSFNIRDGSLWVQGLRVGAVVTDGFDIEYVDSNAHVVQVQFRKHENKLTYHEKQVDRAGKLVMEIDAQLYPLD